VVRQGHLIALVVAFLIGGAVLLVAGASGVQAQASKKEETRCEGTRTIKDSYITNDLPGCPKGGLLLGTEGSDRTISRKPARPSLDGGDGDDTIRGLGGSDDIWAGSGDDVVYGGGGDDGVGPDSGNDIIYGGDGNDKLDSGDDGGDKLYCGAGRDKYIADKNDYVDSSCEMNAGAEPHQLGYKGHDDLSLTSSASASLTPVPLGGTGGPAILGPAAALLFGSGILTYVILRRR
jgi:hypothetical protein